MADEEKLPADLKKIKQLANLALSDADGNEEERRTAAVEALRLMRQSKFVLVREEHLAEATAAVNGARAELAKFQEQANKKMLTGLFLGAIGAKVLGSKGLF